jgi:hypothetical protein
MRISRIASRNLAGVFCVLVLALASCQSAETVAEDDPLKDDFQADFGGEIALTVLDTDFTLAQLAERPTRSIELFEPFAKATTNFDVISFGDLLREEGLSPEMRIVTIALNDYRYSDTVGQFIDNDALLAIFENGEPIPVSSGGPVRIVFEESSNYYSELDAWNWSLRSITME